MLNEWSRYAFAWAVWPGILGAVPIGWFLLWFARKLTARLQGRKGPPLLQPCFDFIKLAGKRTVVPSGVRPALFYGLPLASLTAASLALVMLPLPGNPVASFRGDVVLLLFLLEVPVLCDVLAGYVTRSIYGQVSAMRESVLLLAYNLPFLAAVIAIAQQADSFSLVALQSAHVGPAVYLLAFTGFLIALPARLKSNPFSIPNAEQEIVAGAHIEYNGVPLAMFELAHALELVLLVGLFLVLFVPVPGAAAVSLAVCGAIALVLVAAVTVLATVTARLRIGHALRFYWLWGGGFGAGAILAAWIW